MSKGRTLVAAALALGACGGQITSDTTGESGEALSSYTQRIIGAYLNTDGKGHYQRIALKDDATYVALTAAGQERGQWSVVKPFFGAGHLTILPSDPSGPTLEYDTSLAWFGGGLTLKSGKSRLCYETIAQGYCGIDTDCNGIPFDKQTLGCGDQQHDGNLCTPAGTCTNACVDNGPPPIGAPVPPPPGPHP
jgi:hypothetical protein